MFLSPEDPRPSVEFSSGSVTKYYPPEGFYRFATEVHAFSMFPAFTPALLNLSWKEGKGGSISMDRGVEITALTPKTSVQWAPILWDMLKTVSDMGWSHGDISLTNVIVTDYGLRIIDWENMRPDNHRYDLTGTGEGQCWWGSSIHEAPRTYWGINGY